jgi:hypothetical protein
MLETRDLEQATEIGTRANDDDDDRAVRGTRALHRSDNNERGVPQGDDEPIQNFPEMARRNPRPCA